MSWIENASDAELKRLIKAHSEKRCGNCGKWMISSSCPREKDHTVHMNEYGCKLFDIKNWYKKEIKEMEQELVVRNI